MPNHEEVEGAYWFESVCACTCLSVCLSVYVSVRLSVTLCMQSRMVRGRILKFNIWNVHEK